MNSVLLNSYHAISDIGYMVTWVLGIIFVLAWIFVMYKYLDTSDLND